MQYIINVARATGLRLSMVHYFRVIIDGDKARALAVFADLRTLYREPEYDITVSAQQTVGKDVTPTFLLGEVVLNEVQS